MKTIICPNCKGKGHVMDGGGALLACLSIFGLPLLLFDKNDKNGHTRCECEKCNGSGFIQMKSFDNDRNKM